MKEEDKLEIANKIRQKTKKSLTSTFLKGIPNKIHDITEKAFV